MLRPSPSPVADVERATWEAHLQLAAWNELGRDWRVSNAAKSFKLCGFPSALLASWVNDIVKKCREPSLEAWDPIIPRSSIASAATAGSLEAAASCAATSS
eukprot:jgi/Tetstr1/459750/TSEL_005103.t1